MTVARGNRVGNTGVYRVRDPFKLLVLTGILIVLILIALVANKVYMDHIAEHAGDWLMSQTDNGMWYVVGSNLLAIITFLRLRALWGGTKLDIGDRTIQIPGGNISANDFVDYFKPSFLFQHFLRFTFNLDDVRQISQSTKVKTITRNGIKERSYTYALNMSGTFGAASVWFKNEGKCDELFSAVRELNDMGEPFLRV